MAGFSIATRRSVTVVDWPANVHVAHGDSASLQREAAEFPSFSLRKLMSLPIGTATQDFKTTNADTPASHKPPPGPRNEVKKEG
ncbi:hypothetical protein PTT_01945 [Pyrenophora teres f. teres 0-1]|uniref:Uncharacterized protein n=1 Tax=Pyrenophora teres f. teres (strain 0-1) TaxID=861557 RepID=E3RDB5_PYRTT|nr:hypothetical protein PTT_01945 [Pyrenophora teres f. teres 0-1]